MDSAGSEGGAAPSPAAFTDASAGATSSDGGGGGWGGPFRELYGRGEGEGAGPAGACYDATTDGGSREEGPGGRGGGRWDGRRSSTDRIGGGGGDSAMAPGPGANDPRPAPAAQHAPPAPPAAATRRPVIFLPPLTGTELQAKLDGKPSTPRWWCPRRTSRWFTLWLTLQSLLPWEFPCFADNLRLVPVSSDGGGSGGGGGGGGARPPPGVEVRVGPTLEGAAGDPRVGGEGREGLQPWSSIARELRLRGWTDERLDTHPYDWRLSPLEWSQPGGSFHVLRAAIESHVSSSGGQRVVLLGLSLGGSYAVAFLGSEVVDEAWKEAHVERLVTMSGVWLGTPRSPWDVISGRLEGLEAVLDRPSTRHLLRGIPALAWTFPDPHTHTHLDLGVRGAPGEPDGGGGGPPVLTNLARGREYGAAELGQALRDAGAPQTAAFWEASLLSSPSLAATPPNVSTHCFYSYGLNSAVHVTYVAADFSDEQPTVSYDDGDVTVPHASLAACRSWAVRQAAPVRSYSYFGVVHGMLTSVPEALRDIVNAVAGEAG